MHRIIKTSWNEVSTQVKSINSLLHEVIDSDPNLKNQDLEIYQYQYGDTVGDEHFFYGPSNSAIKSKTIPFCMVLNNYFEMPIKLVDCLMPWKMYKPGDVFPYTRFIPNNKNYEPSNCLSLIAGVKNAFFLINKIADKKLHQNLCKEYGINVPPPKGLQEHFNVFKELVNSHKPEWTADLLVFSENFFNIASKNHDFKEIIFNISHNDKLFRRNIYAYEILLHKLFMQTKEISSSFARDCIKHILYVGCGDLPAYFPSENEQYGPINFLTEAYIEGFKSDSCPIFMAPDFFEPFKNVNHAYFSLNNLDYLFKPEKISSQAKIIKSINSGYSLITDKILKSEFSEKSIFMKTAKKMVISSIIKGDNEFQKVTQDDKVFTKICDKYKLPFPENSIYLSSCISLSYKNT